MKRKFAVLTVLGALVALAVPASSMASMYPAGHQFELSGTTAKLGTSLGSCTITKVTGTIPSAPANETTPSSISVPTVGSCTSGTSLTLSGTWTFAGSSYLAGLTSQTAGGVTMKFSSLPTCKLSSTGQYPLMGVWSNGATIPKLLKSSFHPHSAGPLTWSNDGGSCALAGKTETVSFTAESVGTFTAPQALTATDTTSPSSLVIVGL